MSFLSLTFCGLVIPVAEQGWKSEHLDFYLRSATPRLCDLGNSCHLSGRGITMSTWSAFITRLISEANKIKKVKTPCQLEIPHGGGVGIITITTTTTTIIIIVIIIIIIIIILWRNDLIQDWSNNLQPLTNVANLSLNPTSCASFTYMAFKSFWNAIRTYTHTHTSPFFLDPGSCLASGTFTLLLLMIFNCSLGTWIK